MPLSDRELLDFDRDDSGESRAQRLLVEQPDLYRNHLVIARSLQRWAAGLLVEASVPGVSHHGRVDCIDALLAVSDQLRSGELVPGGRLYDAEIERPPVRLFPVAHRPT